MNVFSAEFLVLFLLGVVVITLRSRSKRRQGAFLPGKQIAIVGQQVIALLSKQTPLACLLADGKKYGDGFQEKNPPPLPHAEGCACRQLDVIQRSRELFSDQEKELPHWQTDLGDLSAVEARYYRFKLIACHREATAQQRNDYAELARLVPVSAEFAARVNRHLTEPPPVSFPIPD